MSDKSAEQIWQEFWAPILMKNGTLDMEQLKKELADFHDMIGEIPTVYSEVTGGKLSKPSYKAATVLAVYREHLEEERERWEQDFREDNDCKCGLEHPDG